MTTITAQTILRSGHSQRTDKVLSTLLLRYPRWIHAELMTHRVFSRNAASSRAIPVAKLIQDVMDNPAVPLFWGKNQKGMQAGDELDPTGRSQARAMWLVARNRAVEQAEKLTELGLHKQIVNRLLEPFAHITVLVSATEWSNFLALRDHPDAEPHIAMLAREIRRELDRTDNIQVLQPGQWHMPFMTPGDDEAARRKITVNGVLRKIPMSHEIVELLIKKSVACSASTSYKTVDGFDMTLEKAIEIHDKLVGSTPIHASPAEHVAQADSLDYYERTRIERGDKEVLLESAEGWDHPEEHGNFVGFRQYRKQLPNECL